MKPLAHYKVHESRRKFRTKIANVRLASEYPEDADCLHIVNGTYLVLMIPPLFDLISSPFCYPNFYPALK